MRPAAVGHPAAARADAVMARAISGFDRPTRRPRTRVMKPAVRLGLSRRSPPPSWFLLCSPPAPPAKGPESSSHAKMAPLGRARSREQGGHHFRVHLSRDGTIRFLPAPHRIGCLESRISIVISLNTTHTETSLLRRTS